MLRQMLIGKIHRARVTAADVNYVGSITIDSELIKAAGILEFENVYIADITNGERLETYVIPGKPGSGEIQINGAAAKCINPGDLIIIMAYAWLDLEEARSYHPHIVIVDQGNHIVDVLKQ